MKKVLSLILAFLLCLSLCACTQNGTGNTQPTNNDNSDIDDNTQNTEHTQNSNEALSPSNNPTEDIDGDDIDFSQPIFQILLGKWNIYPEDKWMENVAQNLEFRDNYTCSLDGKEYTWKLFDWYGPDPMAGDRIDIDIYDGEVFLMRRSLNLSADGVAELSDLGAQPHYSKVDGNSQPETNP